MFYLTFMGGSTVRLKEAENIVITFWGGTEILMPTLAEKITFLRKAKLQGRDLSEAVRRTNVVTLMGGTAFRTPTMAQEIEEMCMLRDSGLVTDDELQELWQEAVQHDTFDLLETVTFMGGAAEEKPSRRMELKGLDSLILKGILSSEDAETLKHMIENPSSRSGGSQIQERLRILLLPPGCEKPILLPSSRTPERKLSSVE